MQGKGIVKFFLVVMGLVTLAQYFFILPTQKVERNADKYAAEFGNPDGSSEEKAAFKQAKTTFLDSMSSEEVFKIPLLKSYTYQDLKAQQLALGLDLKGGMSVVLQVDLREFIRAMADNSKDPTFEEALEKASLRHRTAQSDFITIFAEEFRAVSQGKTMAGIFLKNEALRDQINLNTSDGEVVRILREKANETVNLTFKLLKERIDKLGVTQPNVSLDAARDLIVVELPGIDNPERARTFLQAAAKLEFWKVYRITDPGIQQGLIQANERLAQLEGTVDIQPEITGIDTIYAKDSLGNDILSEIERIDTLRGQPSFDQGPLFDAFQLNTTGALGLAVIGTADKNKRDRVMEMLNRPEIKNEFFPEDLVFLWSKDPVKDFQSGKLTNQYELYAIKAERGGTAPLTGDRVIDAGANPDPQTNQVSVSLKMDAAGAKTWGRLTTEAAQDNNREIAIVLDNEVVSAPRVINPITSGDSQITGTFTIQEAKDLANILQVGKLPAETRIIQESLVGPSLGQDNINRSINALAIGFAIVILFMIFYYGGGGIISIVTLLLNLFFIFGALASMGTVLTLPGIAGIVLTIGMAVDANVIIYERIREELRTGKSLLMSIQDGFHQSYSAIIDANVTTILTAMVLAYFGLGAIKGFAVVLMIGVVSSLFTAVLVGRLVIEGWVTRGRNLSFWNKFSENVLANVNINWMGFRRWGYIFSGTLILVSLISFGIRGFELGVDFKGGYSYNVQFDQSQSVNAQQLREALTPAFDGSTPVVKVVDTENTFNITTSYLIDDPSEGNSDRVAQALFEGVNQIAGGNLEFEQFKRTDSPGTHITSSSQVGPIIADDIKDSSFYSATFALLLIFLYLAIRFSNWKFSLGAVMALFHDVIITLGMFSLFYGVLPFSLEIDQAFVAAILTVIGYSVNDTVIVFDRIREFIDTYAGKSKEEVFNLAINNTLSRTLITSGTTLVVVISLFVFGGGSIKGFAFALMIGILFGTYSSIFVASAVVVDLIKEVKGRKEEKKKSFSKAAQSAR
jgi:SecD/SecF fusion protein